VPEGDFWNLRDVASDAELTNDEGEAPQSLAKVITQGPEGDIQNLRDVAGDAEVMNNEGEARRRPSPKVAEHHEACDPGRSVQVRLSYLGKLLNTPVVIY